MKTEEKVKPKRMTQEEIEVGVRSIIATNPKNQRMHIAFTLIRMIVGVATEGDSDMIHNALGVFENVKQNIYIWDFMQLYGGISHSHSKS
jgi:translation elongation factor EF-1beta